MAMNPAALSTDIQARWIADPACGFISTEHGSLSTEQRARIKALADAVAAAVVGHITSLAVVAVASVSGVMIGGGVSGPGAGTIS